MTKIIGIVAQKLSHSLSPDIHTYWAKKTKTKIIYKKYELQEKDIQSFISKFKKNKNFQGFNVTIPYKENFLNLCDKVSSRAKKIGSVNLIYKKNNIVNGDNTDVVGFAKCYNLLKIKIPRTVLVIGAGGAARSILYYLNKRGIENIDIFAPSFKRMTGLRADFYFKNFVNNTSKLKAQYDLIINASSAGMIGKTKLNRNILRKTQKAKGIIDIVYNPIQTPLLKEATKHNINNIGGLKMLIEQAKPSFERWTNKKVESSIELYHKVEKKIR